MLVTYVVQAMACKYIERHPNMWVGRLLDFQDKRWLAARRLHMSAASILVGLTRTRAWSAPVARRWHDGLDFAKEQPVAS